MTVEVLPDLPTTTETPFGTTDESNVPFYTVRAGIPFEDALVQIAVLLKCAGESSYELCDGGTPQRGLVWSTIHHIEAAQALTDALIKGVSVR